ncbi:DUF1120 domain-containing protein [Pseudomonas putida]|uniref:DUF1120 domain-containing protein n=1 Tax=Pseudomonas putida TaxID=303 RepID=UPI00383B610D
MKHLLTTGILSSVLLVSVTAHAATAGLSLGGTIVPTACTPNFAGGGTISYGDMTAGTLNSNTQTLLPEKTTSLTIACNGSVKFILKATDNKATSVVTSLTTISGYADTQKFGLGAAGNGAKLGAYSMEVTKSTPDKGAVYFVHSSDGGSTWARPSGTPISKSAQMGWNEQSVSGYAPSPYASMQVDIRIVAAIDKLANLPIADEMTIDGSTTFEVQYL